MKHMKQLNYFAVCCFTIVLMVFLNHIVDNTSSAKQQMNDLQEYQIYENYAVTKVSTGGTLSSDEIAEQLVGLTEEVYDDTVIFSPNYYFVPGYSGDSTANTITSTDDLPIITTNDTYFRTFSKAIDVTDIQQGKNILNIAIPDTFTDEASLEMLVDMEKEQYQIDQNNDTLDVELHFITYDSQSFFIPSIYESGYRMNTIQDPIFIVYTKDNLSANNLISVYSGSEIYIELGNTSCYQEFYPYLVHYGLDKNIRNVQNVFQEKSVQITELEHNMVIYSISFIVLIVIYGNMVFFMSISYLEEHKRQLSIMYVHGYGFCRRYLELLEVNTVILVIAMLVYTLCIGQFHLYYWLVIAVEYIALLVALSVKGDTNLMQAIKHG